MFDDDSGLSSTDEFGWEKAEIKSEEKLQLVNNFRMALSSRSSTSSDESDDESEPKSPLLEENKHSDSSDSESSGDNSLNSKHNPERSIPKGCVISLSSGAPLQTEEVSGVDGKMFAADGCKPALCLEDLTEDEEVYLVQCPNSVQPETLRNQLLVSPAASRISVDGQVLEVSSHSHCSQALTFVLPSREDHNCRLVLVKPAGQIVIREHIDVPQPSASVAKKRNVMLPVGLKMRHPLLGADYEKELESYNESLQRQGNNSKLKKKKKKRRRESDGVDSVSNLESVENVHSTKKRKLFSNSKHDNSLIYSEIPVKSEDVGLIHSAVAVKESKKKSRSVEATQEKESTGESNILLKKVKIERDSEVESSTMSDNIKERKKRKRESRETSFETSAGFSETELVTGSKKLKKKIKLEEEETGPVDTCGWLIRNENIQAIHHSKKSKGITALTNKDIAGVSEPSQNNGSQLDTDSSQMERKKKKNKGMKIKKKSLEVKANKHHTVISVEVNKKKHKGKDSSYRFSIPLDFGAKNKNKTHKRKLSLTL
ncbi:uncharacterized protein PF3D7_1225600-like [Bacillus rossius redtenbacheri]|uniref:uncharacterized protein PF3D7_1225600-like n=1 Tax=Bacillus rossius redtenbacheri TaxID=93214 RepID=UPI002FDC7E4C